MKSYLSKLLRKPSKGFTLIELLIVISIISALAIAVFVALNPGQRVQDANNARRAADANTILTAVHASIVDNDGTIPAGISTTEKQIGSAVTGCTIATGTCAVAATADCINLASVIPAYLKSNPIDVVGGTADLTGYSIVIDGNNIVTVKACNAQGTTITASQ